MYTKNLKTIGKIKGQSRQFRKGFGELDLVKWKNPFKSPVSSIQRDPFEKFQNELMQWDSDFLRFPRFSSEFFEKSMIEIDIKEKKDSFVVQADLPGIEKENIKVNIENGMLKITGERKTEKEEKDENYLRSEKFYGKLERVLKLPDNVDEENVKADFKNGVLNLKIKKKEPKVSSGKVVQIE
eukprot:gene9720-1925_t